jgi:murein DD-endopeptidase MepM/ murein hydrolase activator NlpD
MAGNAVSGAVPGRVLAWRETGAYCQNMMIKTSAHRLAAARATLLLAACVALAGCAGSLRAPKTVPDATEREAAEPIADRGGVLHVVQPGETLWRIARTYGVELSDLTAANDIDDPSRIEAGRTLFVPGASSMRTIPTPSAGPVSGDAIFSWPVRNGRLLSPFGVPRRGHNHSGIDIGAKFGQAVLAVGAGQVVYSGSRMRGYGKTVIIRHQNTFSSLYAHNSALMVDEGDWVERGQPIARIGRSGNASTEHCHFELRRNETAVDPLPYLARNDERR